MSGLVKAKKYDWKDSNMALFGSDTEKKVKKESAETEKAWQKLKTLGDGEATVVYRIVKFKVTDWPKDDYGQFFSGDSYIVFNQRPNKDNPDELDMDVHFWIGKHSTQDEYGTAAYKTVELDTFLDDKPVQHREVQGHESKLFQSYFNEISVMKGGADTGFRRVVPEQYKPRLLQFKGTTIKNTKVIELPAKRGNLNSDDVFVIDHGTKLYQFNGKNCDKDEKFAATQWLQKVKSERGGKVKVTEVLEETSCSTDHPAFSVLKDGKSKEKGAGPKGERKMIQVFEEAGQMKQNDLGEPSRAKLKSDDVFIVNTGDHVFVWIGKGASIDERRNAMPYAHNYLSKTETPFLPISVISEGKETEEFKAANF